MVQWVNPQVIVRKCSSEAANTLVQCIDELKFKSERFAKQNLVETHNCVFKSDTIVPEWLREALLETTLSFHDIPEQENDWHPGSNRQVLDLVHPSLYPLVYGQSLILPDTTIGLSDCFEKLGCGEILPVPPKRQKGSGDWRSYDRDDSSNKWSRRFQWPPSEFKVSAYSEEVK